MGIIGFLKFALICIHFLAWPAIALVYPLFASIRAVETCSEYQLRKLVVYWTIFSLISLFEFVFVKIIEWIPFWSSIRLIAIFWLVIPQFHGACHAYQKLVRPVLSVYLRAVINRLYKTKAEKPSKKETFLDIAEKYIKENGSEALEKLIASKSTICMPIDTHECKECNNSHRDPQPLEPEEKNAATTLKQLKEADAANSSQRYPQPLEPKEKDAVMTLEPLKEPDASQLDNETSDATKKIAAAEAEKQVQHAESAVAAWVPKGADAAAKVKEAAPPEASVENRQPETPPLKKTQQEWTCDLCKVTATSEKTLNDHLQGSKHMSKCEALKASRLNAKDTGPSPSATGNSNQYAQSDTAAWVLEDTNSAARVEEAAPPEASIENRRPETPPLMKAHQEWTCDLCKVTATSEKTLNDHLLGSKHKSKCEALKASMLNAKDTGASPLATGNSNQYAQSNTAAWVPEDRNSAARVEEAAAPEASAENRRPETPPLKKAQQEWTCDLCKVTATSEKTLNDHLQGSKHKSKCEALKASRLNAKDTGPSPSATGNSNQYAQSDTAAWVPEDRNSAARVEEAAPPEASVENRWPETPPLKKAQQEWTCDLCKVTATSEKTLNDHLLGSKHKSKCEALKASRLNAKDIGPSPSVTGNLNQYAQSDTAACVPEDTNSAAKVEEAAPPEASVENRRPETPPLKKAQQEWTCDLCKVTATSEKTLNDHLLGSKHKSKCEALKASRLNTKDTGPSPSATGNSNQYTQSDTAAWVPEDTNSASKVEEAAPPEASVENRRPEIPPLMKAQQEWTCDLCKVTATSEKTLNDYLLGSKHKSKCEALKASRLNAKDTGPSPSATGNSNQYAQSDTAAWVPEGADSAAKVEEAAPLEASAENRCPKTPPLKKVQQKWTCDLCNVTTTSEKTLNDHFQGSKHKSKCEALKASKLNAEDIKPSPLATGNSNQYAQSDTAAWVPEDTNSASKVEEAAPPEASVENRRPETPPLMKAQQEWTCDLCKVTATSEKTLNDYLLGSKHESKCEALKASRLNTKDTGPSPSVTGNSNQYAQSDTAAWVPEGADSAAKVEEAAPLEASAENRCPKTPPLKKVQQKWTCDLCNVTTTSEKTLNDHFQGSKHRSKCEALKASKLNAEDIKPSPLATGNSNQYAQSDTAAWVPEGTDSVAKLEKVAPPAASAEDRCPKTPPLKKVQQKWTCDLCKVTATSEKTLNDHFQGSKHKSKCESLKASKLNANDTGPSPSATGNSTQGNREAVKNKVGEGSQKSSSEKTQEKVQIQAPRDQQNQAKPKQDGGASQVFKWCCNLCNVKLSNNIDLDSHIKGRRHLSNIKKMVEPDGVVS